MAVLLPGIVHQDAAQRAVAVAGADIDGQVVGDLGEHAFLQQEGGHAVADLELVFAERAVAPGHDPDVQDGAGDHGDAGQGERRARESASGDSPAARMTVSSRSPARR